jgi:hypothetical protein
MKLGIAIYSNDPETVWNTFRLGNFSLKEGAKPAILKALKTVHYQP